MPKKRIKSAPAMPEELRRFGLEVATARRGKGMSQIALANEVGISNKSINHLERAGNWPSVPVLIKLRRTLANNNRSLLS